MKITLDSNIYISAAILGRVCEEILNICILNTNTITVFSSVEIINEIKDKLKNKFNWEDYKVSFFEKYLLNFIRLVCPDKKIKLLKDDPDDDKIIECAFCSGSNFIISGDKHLLKLKEYKEIKIIPPSEFQVTLSYRLPVNNSSQG